jgi:RNA polymerase sigma-70 factor (ECF subfamily)
MNEKELVRDVDSNFETFAELYRRNITRVHRYHMLQVANANAAEELTSQTFITALKKFPSFRGRDSFSVRVLKIAVEKCRKDHRASRRELPDDAILHYQVSSLPTDKAAMQRMEIESVSRALKQISSDRAEAIILYYFGDLTNSEISVVLNRSSNTIEALISSGWEDLLARTSLLSSMETSDLETEALLNKLSHIAAQIKPDPFFISELEKTLAANYQPKTKWTPPLQQFSTIIGWAVLIGIAFFLLNWRITPNTPTTHQATTRPPTQDAKKTAAITLTSTPHRPTASPTATDIPLREYIVQSGDTCTFIANKFGVTIDLLITLNHLNNTCDIWADQKLKIPITSISTPSS